MKRFIFLALLLAGCAAPQPQLQPLNIKNVPGQLMLPVKVGDDIIFLPLHLYTPSDTNAPQSK